MITAQEKFAESRSLADKALAILGNAEASAEDKANAGTMFEDAKVLMNEGDRLSEVAQLSAKLADFAAKAPIADAN